MKRLKLKSGSLEFEDRNQGAAAYPYVPVCDHENCGAQGLYRAPRSRHLNSYFYFCLDHVRAYNRQWDYFNGMNPAEIHAQMRQSIYGDRPTWRTTISPEVLEATLWQKAADFASEYIHMERENSREQKHRKTESDTGTWNGLPEKAREALAVMDLDPPLDRTALQQRYRKLVKENHPDIHGGNRDYEERLKQINWAYTLLIALYETLYGEEKNEKDTSQASSSAYA